MVTRVLPGHDRDDTPGWGLELLGYAGAWDATAFRKVVPPPRTIEQAMRRRADAPAGRPASAD
jgi:hypothetical protein